MHGRHRVWIGLVAAIPLLAACGTDGRLPTTLHLRPKPAVEASPAPTPPPTPALKGSEPRRLPALTAVAGLGAVSVTASLLGPLPDLFGPPPPPPPPPSPSPTTPHTPSPPPPADALPPSTIGVNVDGLDWWEASAERSANLTMVADSGFTVVRSILDWKVVEPVRPDASGHSWRFDVYDRWMLDLNARGLTWAPMLAFSPDWATSSWWASDPTTGRHDPKFAPPSNPGDFAEFAAEVVRRYGPNGSLWSTYGIPAAQRTPLMSIEIWNEPNTYGFWQGGSGPDPVRYAQLLSAAHTNATAVDPSVTVISGGLAAIDDTQYWPSGTRKFVQDRAFLRAMFDAAPHLETAPNLAIGYHPYGSDAEEVIRRTQEMRAEARAVGAGGRPLYLNEFGWSTPPPGIQMTDENFTTMSDDARALEMQRATRELVPSTCGVRQLMAYTWVAREAGSQSTVDWMGLTNRTVEPRGALNATGRAFSEVTRNLRAGGGQPTTLCGPRS